jgi:ketosteroid isomerase-like protein
MKNVLTILFTLFLAAGSGAGAAEPQDAKADASKAAVLKTLEAYRTAMKEKSLEKLALAVHPDLTIMEGVHLNTSWADYRDNHIGPEMKEWKEFRVEDPSVVSVTTAGDWAYAVTRATYTLVFPDKSMVIDSAETFVLVKKDGKWLIRHIHSSGKKRPEAKP